MHRLSPSVTLLRTQTDERLVALAREGSEAAFTALVERYRRLILRACRRILSDGRAEDATQQACVAAWNALRRGDDVRDVRAWLLRIARNTSLNALRTPGYDYDELAESLRATEAPDAELERREVMRATLAGLAALPERQREALLRTAVEGAAHADIARDLGLSEGATRQLVLRARTALRTAATAITPFPLMAWIAGAGGGAAAAGAAGAGAGAGGSLLAKAGVVAVLAGGAVAAPVIVVDATRDSDAAAETRKERARAADEAASATRAQPVSTAAPAARAATPVRAGARLAGGAGSRAGGKDDRRGRGRGRGRGADDGQRDASGSGPSGAGSGSPGSGSGGSGSSGSSGPSGSSGSGSSGSGHDAGDDHGGSSGSGGSESSGSSGSGRGRGSDDTQPDDHGGSSGDGGSSSGGSGGSGGSGSSGGGSDDDAVAPAPTAAPLVTPQATVDDHGGRGGDSGSGKGSGGGDDDGA